MKKNQIGHGVIVPMVTPFTGDQQIDFIGVENLVRHIHNAGADPFILGTTGESASIAEADRPDYVRKMVEVVNGKGRAYAGISSPSFKTSIQAAQVYFDLGVDAVVAHPPAYYPLSADQLLTYFEALADSIPGPLILYNITSVTHISIPVPIVDKLSRHEKIIGVKDSERDEKRLEDSLALWSQRDDFVYLIGWGVQMANGLQRGADGLVPSTGNITPKEYVAMMSAAKAGDHAQLNRLQEYLNNVSAVYQKNRSLGESLAALKAMLTALDICQPHVLPPLNTLDSAEQHKIRLQMQEFQLKVEI
jgi:4-hydroxy-tetrahydrodipicolinate synthase